MSERSFSSGDYRYGFQGQEMDNEIKGNGNSINFKFRMYDPRIGRFFATDPLESKYPYLTPYQFSSNQPIHAIEYEGLESAFELGHQGRNDGNVSEIDKRTPMEQFAEWVVDDKPTSEKVGDVFNFLAPTTTFKVLDKQGRGEKVTATEIVSSAIEVIGIATTIYGATKPNVKPQLKTQISENISTKISTSKNIPVVKSASTKLTSLAEKFGVDSKKILKDGLKGQKFKDVGNDGNINVFSARPDGKSGAVRITLDPKGERVISAGLVKTKDVVKGIQTGRFKPIKE